MNLEKVLALQIPKQHNGKGSQPVLGEIGLRVTEDQMNKKSVSNEKYIDVGAPALTG